MREDLLWRLPIAFRYGKAIFFVLISSSFSRARAHSSAFTSQTQLSSDMLLEISCYSPDRLEKCSNETPYRWFQLRVLTRGAICPSSPPKPQKMFLFRLPHINILWGGGGGGFCELTAEAKLSCLSYLVFYLFSFFCASEKAASCQNINPERSPLRVHTI